MVLGQSGINIIISAQDKFSAVFNKASLSMASFQKAAIPLAAIGAGIAVGFGKAIKTSMDFESAFTGVRKTVELSEAGFADLEQRFKDISASTPIAFTELSRIGELAGQLGVSGVDNLEKFTKTIADISVTTNLTAEAAATDFARIANVMQEPLENVDRMGATVVELGNNFATTEAEISTFAQRIAGAGKIVGLTTSDVFAIGTALSSVGVEAEAGGTAVQTALLKIDESVINGGAKLRTFATTAGMTSKEFSTLWETDAATAFEKFILGLGKQGDGAQKTLQDVGLGGIRTARSFLSLANAGDLISQTLQTSTSAWEENNALTEEAEKRYATLQSQVDIVKNKFAILGDEIGDRLAPFLQNVLIPALDWLITTWQNMSPAMQNAILIFGGVTVAVTLLAAAVALLTLVSSPWLLIIGAIIIVITAIILAIVHWKDILMWFIKFLLKGAEIMDSTWEWIKDGFIIAWEVMKNAFIKVWNMIIAYYEGAINLILRGINAIISGINKIPGINIPLIPKVDLSGFKGEMSDIGALSSSLKLERESRAEAFGKVTDQIIVNIEGNIYGTDPDEMAEALQDKINPKILT